MLNRLFEFDVHIGKWRTLVGTRDIQNGSVTAKHLAPGAITAEKIKPGTFTDKYLYAFLNLVDIHMEENGDIIAEIDESIIPGEFIPGGGGGKVTSEDIQDGTIQEEDINPELLERIDNGPDATDDDMVEILNF